MDAAASPTIMDNQFGIQMMNITGMPMQQGPESTMQLADNNMTQQLQQPTVTQTAPFQRVMTQPQTAPFQINMPQPSFSPQSTAPFQGDMTQPSQTAPSQEDITQSPEKTPFQGRQPRILRS